MIVVVTTATAAARSIIAKQAREGRPQAFGVCLFFSPRNERVEEKNYIILLLVVVRFPTTFSATVK